MTEFKNYYEVVAKCGHVGRRNYIPIKFAVIAEDGKEAAKIARYLPRVKHNHKDAILKVTKIDYERYLEIIENNNNDEYLKCHSKQDQNQIENFEERLVVDNHYQEITHDKVSRIAKVTHKIKKFKTLEKSAWEDMDYDYAY